jgi:hypothetical protein
VITTTSLAGDNRAPLSLSGGLKWYSAMWWKWLARGLVPAAACHWLRSEHAFGHPDRHPAIGRTPVLPFVIELTGEAFEDRAVVIEQSGLVEAGLHLVSEC